MICQVTNNHATARHRRLRGAFGMPFIACAGKGCTHQIGQQIGPHRAAAADTSPLVLGLEIRLIMDIAEAQSTGIETVFIRCGCPNPASHPEQLEVTAAPEVTRQEC